jgi:hypothetical protein
MCEMSAAKLSHPGKDDASMMIPRSPPWASMYGSTMAASEVKSAA